MAHEIARELDITPWEALLLCVRRAAGWSAFYTSKLAAVTDDEELKPGGEAWAWVQGSREATAALSRFSKLAVDAGVAAMLVRQAQDQGTAIASVFNSALEAVDMPAELEAALRSALRVALENYGEQPRQLVA